MYQYLLVCLVINVKMQGYIYMETLSRHVLAEDLPQEVIFKGFFSTV